MARSRRALLDPFLVSSPTEFEPDPLWYLRHFTTTVVHRFWGNVGLYEGPMTPFLVVLATLLALVAVAVAVVRPSARGVPGSRWPLAIFGSLLAICGVQLAALAYGLYLSSGTTAFMQGRYLFGAMVPFAVLVATGVDRMVGRRAPAIVLLAALVMQLDAVRAALRGWWAERDAASGGRSMRCWPGARGRPQPCTQPRWPRSWAHSPPLRSCSGTGSSTGRPQTNPLG